MTRRKPRPGPGRPPGPTGSQRTARLVVRVTPAEAQAYRAAARRAGVSMGEWVRLELADAVGAWARVDKQWPRMEPAAAEKEHGG